MNKLNNCQVENCIPTPTSCNEWNGGDIEYLGICNGDSLNNLLWEVVTKLEDIAGEDLSNFDVDSLLDICQQSAPVEVSLINILNIIKNNQICLKDFIDDLSEQIASILNTSSVNVNLRCYATFDNLGNSLSITRDQLDQLVINNLCNHEDRIETLEGTVINLQNQINLIDPTATVEELSFPTCVNPSSLPTSSQVINLANAHCNLEDATGDSTDIASALSQTDPDDNSNFGLLPGWILVPANWAEDYNNMKIKLNNIAQRVLFMEENCCASTCEDVKIGFSAVYNEDGTGLILRFTNGAGTNIPTGWEDNGSTGTITDADGNTLDFSLSIENNLEEEIILTGLNTFEDLQVSLNANMTNGTLVCQKCVGRTVKANNGCSFCTISVTGTTGSIAIIYEGDIQYGNPGGSSSSTTTTTSGS